MVGWFGWLVSIRYGVINNVMYKLGNLDKPEALATQTENGDFKKRDQE